VLSVAYKIDGNRCIECYTCESECHFEAIADGEIDAEACVECGACVSSCPANAIVEA
jgi:ferredoxin